MTRAQPVKVENAEPIPVELAAGADTPAEIEARAVAAAASVDARALTREDQRRISGIWERTQQLIALSVVWVALLVATIKSVQASMAGVDSTEAGVAFVFLASVANLVIGFYFGRTNHQRVGGDAAGNAPGELRGR